MKLVNGLLSAIIGFGIYLAGVLLPNFMSLPPDAASQFKSIFCTVGALLALFGLCAIVKDIFTADNRPLQPSNLLKRAKR